MSTEQEQIVDVCLEEVLAGQSPPDLSQRILSRYRASLARGQPVQPATPISLPATKPDFTNGSVSWPQAQRARLRLIRHPAWLGGVLAAGLLAIMVGYGLLPSPAPDELAPAQKENSRHDRPIVRNEEQTSQPQGREDLPATQPSSESSAPQSQIATAPHSKAASTPATQAVPPASTASSKASAAENNNPTVPSIPASPTTPDRSTPGGGAGSLVSSRSDDEVIALINQQIRQRWQEEGLKPAAPATDSEWVRRVYLDVLGRIPTVDETNRYTADRLPQKKRRLLDELLTSDHAVEEYARNWANIWSGLLIGRGLQPGSLASREGLHQYLRRSFQRNKPYDQFVAELVSAEGANQPGEEDFNGAVNFLLDNLQENGRPATAKTARIFLGQQVQCTQCHNHPFNESQQNQFWDFSSFFRQARAEVRRGNGIAPVAVLTDVNFPGEGRTNLDEAEVYWEQRNGLLKTSYPVFVDGTPIDPSGDVGKVNRRDELARLMTRSPLLSQTLVNRMWGHFLGYGFTRPVDDFGPHNPPSHPELLNELTHQFTAAGFDVRRLIRWVALSESYGLSSRRPRETKDDPAAGQTPLFSHFYLRQMRAEELYESLLVAAGEHGGGPAQGRNDLDQHRTKAAWLEQFAVVYQTDENDEATTFDGTIAQALMMFNGDLIKRATSGARGSLLYEVARSEKKPADKVKHLFTAALSRKPTPQELARADELWRLRQGDTQAALSDVWWAVLNSNEFILNH